VSESPGRGQDAEGAGSAYEDAAPLRPGNRTPCAGAAALGGPRGKWEEVVGARARGGSGQTGGGDAADPAGADGVSGLRVGGVDGDWTSRPYGFPVDGRSPTVWPLDTLSWSSAGSTCDAIGGVVGDDTRGVAVVVVGVSSMVVGVVSLFWFSLSDNLVTVRPTCDGGLGAPLAGGKGPRQW
jgi:hypothetical protein